MLTGSCHCGAVRIEVSEEPSSLTQCTCSVCRRYGALWAYYTRKTARVLGDRRARRSYSWNDRVIEFFHCTTCGCLTHYESIDESDDSRVAINGRMFSPGDTDGLRVRTFDGAETWKYLDD